MKIYLFTFIKIDRVIKKANAWRKKKKSCSTFGVCCDRACGIYSA